MSGPSPGYTPSHPPTSTTSALDVSHSSVRRRVSGPHAGSGGGVASTESSEAAQERGRYENPFDDAHKAVPQRKLPALGRELFSDDEDVAVAHAPPPAIQDQAHPPPIIPTGAPQSSYPSPYNRGTAIPRLPTPNFAAAHKSNGRADDTNLFGLLSKFTQPFRAFKAQSSSEVGRIDDGTIDKDNDISTRTGDVAVVLEGPRTEFVDTMGNRAPNPDLAPGLPTTMLDQATATDGQARTLALSAPLDTTVKLVNAELTSQSASEPTCPDTDDNNHGEDDAESDGESSTRGILRQRRPPRSPTLLAAIHGATDRFTRRFPVSMSYRKANGREGEQGDEHLLALLGYGETGAIVEWPNAWTPEKWSLLLSVCSVSRKGVLGS
ncbi:hypothetical protein FRC08_003725 [Ceratobasidium sp. 394]|nr:hypothetical protein FRC08_003725 [Ceratobasidium sp. 394]